MKQTEEAKNATTTTTTTTKKPQDTQRSQFCKLAEACKRKDLATIRKLLGEHPELLNHHDKHHRNLLHYTAIQVLDRADKNQAPDGPQRTKAEPPESANNAAAAAACLDCFRYLLARCAPKLCSERDQDGLTVLHLAVISCNVGLVREILHAEPTDGGRTLAALATALDKEHHGPLHWAVITNNLECVKMLVAHSGVRLAHQPDLNGASPLHYATQTSDYPKYRAQLRQMLKNATGSNSPSSSSSSSSSSPSPAGNQSSASATPSSGDSVDATKQQHPASEKKCARKLERSETTTREPEVGGRSFEDTGSCATRAASSASHNLDILRHLVRLPGVNLECRDRDLRTPLLWAASSGNRQAILLLLQSGADPLCQDANKLGPLHCAASHGFTDCLECFLSGGAAAAAAVQQRAVNQPDNLACTPLFYAVLSGNIDCVELLLDRGARHDWQDVKGRTAGHFAALKGQLNTLKLLESRGANLWLANKQGDLPLHYAIKSGRQQVVAWLLDHSPYERSVNAINNTGRAPVHLALLKGNPTLVEFLVRRGANLNQLVKVKAGNKGKSAGDKDAEGEGEARAAPACYRYETALDMAKRLNARDCLELLERNSAKSAAWVLAHREQQPVPLGLVSSAHSVGVAGTTRSLFDVQANEVGASPIGFETSGSSAEPPHSVSEPTQARGPARLPKLPARPAPLVESAAPQLSDSTNSSALSQSSLTSVRGARGPPATDDWRAGAADDESRGAPERQRATAARRPYRGGINYHNERINASIKCKLYENGHHSFPPLCEPQNRKHHAGRHHQRHSAGSLAAGGAAGQQEIITNVNVYTTSPHCLHCIGQDEAGECPDCTGASQRRAQMSDTTVAAAAKTGGGRRRSSRGPTRAHAHEFSETSDTSDATSEILYDEDSDRGDGGGEGDAHLPPLGGPSMGEKGVANSSQPPLQSQQQARYLPPSQAYTQHLPVILSAEEERSTSGDTNNTGRQSVSPGDVDSRAGPAQAPVRARQVGQVDDRGRPHDHQVRSPVAEYIRGHRGEHHQRAVSMGPPRTVGDVRGWSQHDQPRARATDYSQVRAKVDSHRNDSGLSMSHFGDDLGDGTCSSSVGRRSKSWSTLDSQHPPGGGPATGGRLPHQQQPGGRSPSSPQGGEEGASSRTIIRTRRLSVDSVELATSVEKSIRKYRQESKLFEELQNLKRNQIRSGRANEALLVKRLVEHFRHESQRDTLTGLDAYGGPYTYQAYELYLYDQLRKISKSNQAKLAGARVPHKFTYQELAGGTVPLGSSQPPAPATDYEARDFFEEDLKAELELQRVIQRSEFALREQALAQTDSPLANNQSDFSVEPSGALEDIRVRRTGDRVKSVEQVAGVADSGDDEPERQHPVQDDAASEVGVREDQQVELPTSPRAGRAFAGSSTASSRRSSVEVEKEKLESLPLRVASTERRDDELDRTELSALAAEKERRQIEAQALDLTAAIITDALGNVSRAGSPVGQRRRADGDAVDRQPAAVDSDANSTAADRPAQEDSETKSDESTQRAAAIHGRRRSVVNIGNKMEIIYHNVGIEIDTVGENPPSDDDDDGSPRVDPATARSESSGVDVEPKTRTGEPTVDQAAKLERVREHEEGQGEGEDILENSPGQHQEEELPESTTNEAREAHTDGNESELNREEGEEHARQVAQAFEQREGEDDDDEQQQQSESMAHTPSSSIVALEPEEVRVGSNALERPSATFSRRASSPQGGGSRRTQSTAARRLSVDSSHRQECPTSTADMIVVQRKVFNGFDLDSLHAHRRKHLAREPSGKTEETHAGSSGAQLSGSKVRAAKTHPARLRPRLSRSRPPAGPYKVYVPTELIHARWLAVKRHEQRRTERMMQEGEEEGKGEEFEGGELEHSHVAGRNQLVQASDSTTERAAVSRAKSQPSLDGRELGANHNGECSNFTLIYELNKSAGTSAAAATIREEEARRRAHIEQAHWCQRRITKIVDVRTLKRTLSLPECLIYSNDLLKRFNILKL